MTILSTRFVSAVGLAGFLVLAGSITSGCGDSGGAGGGGTAGTANTSTGTGTGTGGAGPDSPIDAPDNTWTYVPFPDSKCMNGTSTGIGINKNSASKDVIIFLQGGNACFNTVSCAETAHKNGFGPADFPMEQTQYLDTAPFFNRTSAQNPLKDYNYVYIPYCTGDLHFGDNDTMVGGQMRTFHGANNMDQYLKRVVPTFPDAAHVIISGVSAGGFGAALNYDRVAQAFPNVKVSLIDDSGPPMIEPAVPVCLQKAFYDTWGFGNTLPTACTGCKPANEAFLHPFVDYTTSTYPDARLGLISSTSDKTISLFLGFAHDNCANLESEVAIGPTVYADGLANLRDVVLQGKTNFKMFLIDGVNTVDSSMQDSTQHVWLYDDPNGVISHSTKLIDWLNDLLTGSSAWANTP